MRSVSVCPSVRIFVSALRISLRSVSVGSGRSVSFRRLVCLSVCLDFSRLSFSLGRGLGTRISDSDLSVLISLGFLLARLPGFRYDRSLSARVDRCLSGVRSVCLSVCLDFSQLQTSLGYRFLLASDFSRLSFVFFSGSAVGSVCWDSGAPQG